MLAAITVNIPTYVFAIAAGVVAIPVIVLIAKMAREQEEKERRKQVAEERTEVENLLPQPWLRAYDKLEDKGSYATRNILFSKWMSQQPVLPKLSLDALTKIAETVSGSTWNSSFKHVAEKLAPYLDADLTEDQVRHLPQESKSVNPVLSTTKSAECGLAYGDVHVSKIRLQCHKLISLIDHPYSDGLHWQRVFRVTANQMAGMLSECECCECDCPEIAFKQKGQSC